MNEIKKTNIKINFEIDKNKLSNIKMVNDITDNFFNQFSINKIESDLKQYGNDSKSINYHKTVIIHISNGIDLTVQLTDLYYQLSELVNDIYISTETLNETKIEYC